MRWTLDGRPLAARGRGTTTSTTDDVVSTVTGALSFSTAVKRSSWWPNCGTEIGTARAVLADPGPRPDPAALADHLAATTDGGSVLEPTLARLHGWACLQTGRPDDAEGDEDDHDPADDQDDQHRLERLHLGGAVADDLDDDIPF